MAKKPSYFEWLYYKSIEIIKSDETKDTLTVIIGMSSLMMLIVGIIIMFVEPFGAVLALIGFFNITYILYRRRDYD